MLCAGNILLVPPNISSVSPEIGSLQSATVVTLRGYNIRASAGLSCAFGTLAATAATWLSTTSLKCTAPASGGPAGAATVSVSGNGVDFSSSGVSFVYGTVLCAVPGLRVRLFFVLCSVGAGVVLLVRVVIHSRFALAITNILVCL